MNLGYEYEKLAIFRHFDMGYKEGNTTGLVDE